MTDEPRQLAAPVTIVLLTHNRATDVLTTIERLLSLPDAAPLIVVDNGSTDGTATVISQRFPDVELIALRKNVGAAGRNVGIRHATSPYVALCDDDTWWATGSVTRAAELLSNHSRLAIVTARVLVGPDERVDPACHDMARSPLTVNGSLPGRPVLGFLAGASVVRRSAILSVGGFHPRLFLGCEEALLAWDLAAREWSMAYVPELVVHHHPSPQRDIRRRRTLLLRNKLWVAWLRRPVGAALIQTVRLVAESLREPVLLSGITEALAGLSWIIHERHVVPSHLEAALKQLEKSPSPGAQSFL